jgi:hypothetical protein
MRCAHRSATGGRPGCGESVLAAAGCDVATRVLWSHAVPGGLAAHQSEQRPRRQAARWRGIHRPHLVVCRARRRSGTLLLSCSRHRSRRCCVGQVCKAFARLIRVVADVQASLAFTAAVRFRTLLLCVFGSIALVPLASVRACAAMPLALAIGIPANLTYGYVVLLAQYQATVRDVWLQVRRKKCWGNL